MSTARDAHIRDAFLFTTPVSVWALCHRSPLWQQGTACGDDRVENSAHSAVPYRLIPDVSINFFETLLVFSVLKGRDSFTLLGRDSGVFRVCPWKGRPDVPRHTLTEFISDPAIPRSELCWTGEVVGKVTGS